jgi:hypothetical protein
MPRSHFVLVALGLALAVAAGPRLARADALQTQSFAAWRVMDECAKQANKAFPDHTPDGNAKREANRQECLRAHRLPVTAPVPAPPAK